VDEEAFIEEEIRNEALYDRIDPEELADITSTRNEVEEQEQGEEIQEDEQEPDPVLHKPGQEDVEPEPEEEQVQVDVPEQGQEDLELGDPDEEPEDESRRTRLGRAIVKPTRYIEQELSFCIKPIKTATDILNMTTTSRSWQPEELKHYL
jgi:hypothetical protein